MLLYVRKRLPCASPRVCLGSKRRGPEKASQAGVSQVTLRLGNNIGEYHTCPGRRYDMA